MEQANNMEILKELIRQQIKSQEEANASFNSILLHIRKILKRMVWFSILVSLILLCCIFFIIYTENQPQSIVNNALKTAKDLETRISLQREYINMNTKDINDLKDSSHERQK